MSSWYDLNPEIKKEVQRKSKRKNRDHYREYEKNKYATDPEYRLKKLLRARLYKLFKKHKKSGSVIKDLGCSLSELKFHLEKQFKENMNWTNHGINGWHIDHIIPLSKFNLSDRQEFLKACHYTNLQPLWAAENIRKSNLC